MALYKKAKISLNVRNGGKSGGSPKTKKIVQYDLNGNFLKIFNSQTEAAVELNILKESLSNCIRNKTYYSGNFLWSSYEDYLNLIIPEKHTKINIPKKIFVYDKNLNLLQEFTSLNQAANFYKISATTVKFNLNKILDNCKIIFSDNKNLIKKSYRKTKVIKQFDSEMNLVNTFRSVKFASTELNISVHILKSYAYKKKLINNFYFIFV